MNRSYCVDYLLDQLHIAQELKFLKTSTNDDSNCCSYNDNDNDNNIKTLLFGFPRLFH